VAQNLKLAQSAEEVKAAKTDSYIVDRLKAALDQLGHCRSVAEWVAYGTVLAAVAPEPESAAQASKHRDDGHSMAKVATRLGLNPKSRYVKATGQERPRALKLAIKRRGAFDEAVDLGKGDLKVGDAATSRGRPCMIVEIDYEADTCKLAFEIGVLKLTRTYTCIYKGKDVRGKAPFPKGSARLRGLVPSLAPEPRATRLDEKAEAARPKVKELFDAEGARSPSQRDQVRRRLGVGIYEKAQALFIYTKFATLYKLFCEHCPEIKISFALFKKLRPWYVRRAKQATCECKHCVNFKNYMDVLHSLVKLFDPVVHPPTEDACEACEADEANDDDEAETDSWAGKSKLLELLKFCAIQSKSEMCKFALCSGAFDGAGKEDCINCKCPRCGFDRIWSKGLRPHITNAGNILSTAPVEFQSTVKWTRIRSSGKTSPGEAKQPSYVSNTGTIVQFLDEFERDVFKKYPHHRFTIQRQKAMAAEFERCRGPGWIQADVDFAMDGEIPPPAGIAVQSDHWAPMTFTAFIEVVSWLVTAIWIDRSSELPIGAVVTVEPAEKSTPESIEPAEGSYGAEVVQAPTPSSLADGTTIDPERRLYGIRRFGADADSPLEMVERRWLRHRVRHTKAFVHISNDKTHDSQAAQTFMNKTIDYIEEHYVKTGKEIFFGWHFHSDNAPSHFKSSQTMNYFTKLPARLASWAAGTGLTFCVFWEFGAPGHGKGVWDGIGAWIKRTVRQDIVDHRPPGNRSVLTASGDVLSPEQVAEHLKARFQTDEYVQQHLKSTINEVVIIYTSTSEIVRVTTNKYSRMPGMKKTFLWMAVREEVVLQRSFACWCPACMRASAPGEGTMNSSYVVNGCVSPSLPWKETVISREDAEGVATARTITRTHSRSLRDQLLSHFSQTNTPVWVAVQNRGEDEPDQYWIGRATRMVVYKEGGSVEGTGGRVRYDAGDAEISVEWFERDISGGDERRIFKRWDGAVAGKTYSFNSTELRAIKVAMQLVPPVGGVPLNVVQHEARPQRIAAAQGNERRVEQMNHNPLRTNPHAITSAVHQQRASPPDQLWEIPAGDEKRVLEKCCP
jgi:hypothetical protein